MAKALRFPCDLARIGADAASRAGYALVAAMVTHKIKSMLLRFKQKRAIIVATLEGGEAVTNTILEEPDGVFGGNTENAVKRFQEYALLEQTGAAECMRPGRNNFERKKDEP